MFAITVSAIVGFLFFLQMVIIYKGQVNKRAAAYSAIYLFMLLFLAVVNFELEIIEQKFASQFSFDVYMGQESVLSNSAFLLQCFVNIPAFVLTGHWSAAIGTNVALMATVFYIAFDESPPISLIMLAPAVVNFSMFALRDPIIGVLAMLLTFEMVRQRDTAGSISKQIGLGLLFLLVRPENIVIFGYSKVMIWFDRGKQQIVFYLMLPLIVILMFGLAYSAPKLLGIKSDQSIASLPSEANEFYESRANRNDTGSGGGSNILGGRLASMPIFIRFPIQVTTFFVLPLPHEIKGVTQLFAFMDSIVFISLCIYFHRKSSREAVVIFWIYVLAVAFFSSNYGNVFRLRLPCYFVMLAGLLRR